ncbi:MAG: O-antigen polymerase [Gammaproteobacteria bacterium]
MTVVLPTTIRKQVDEAATFVAIRPMHRVAAIAIPLLYLALVFQRSMQAGSTVDDGLLIALTVNVLLRLLPFLWIGRGVGWFHPIVFSAVLGFLDLLRSFDVYSMGMTSHIALPGGSDYLNGLLAVQTNMSSIGLVAYYLGYFAGPRLPIVGKRVRLDATPSMSKRTVYVIVGAALIWFLYIGGPSGIIAHLSQLTSGGSRSSLAGSYYFLLPIELALAAWWVWFAHVKKIRAVTVAVGAALSVAHYMTFGSRSILVYCSLVALVIWGIRRSVFPAGRVLVLALVGTYAITVLAHFGPVDSGGALGLSLTEDRSIADTIATGFSGEISSRATSGSGSLAIYANVPESVGYLNGSSYVAALMLPIPRSLWSGKPGLIDGRVGEAFFGTNSGIPASAAGEAYWNFGIPGIAGAFFLFGTFHRWLARMVSARRREAGAIVLYVIILVFFRSPDSSSVVSCVQWLALVLIVMKIGGMVRLKERAAMLRR